MKCARVARTNSIVPVYMFEHEKIAAWRTSCFMCRRLLSPPRQRHVCGHEQSFPANVVAPRNHTQANHQNSPVDIHRVGYLAHRLHPHHKVSSTDKPSMSFSSDGPRMDNKACKKDHITAKTYPKLGDASDRRTQEQHVVYVICSARSWQTERPTAIQSGTCGVPARIAEYQMKTSRQ